VADARGKVNSLKSSAFSDAIGDRAKRGVAAGDLRVAINMTRPEGYDEWDMTSGI
jgi:hypothetical protein